MSTVRFGGRAMVGGMALVAAWLLAGCDESSGSSGGGAGGKGGAGQQGSSGQSELSDGTLGSSCTGSCSGNLSCYTSSEVPGGYCTASCSSDAACGSTGHCYQTVNGPACLRRCGGDADCRPGYSCQGDAGNTVCFPAATGGGSGGGTGAAGSSGGGDSCIANEQLTGGWWQSTVALEQARFYADGTAEYESYSQVSGTVPYSGSWQLACPTLTLNLSGSSPVSFTVQGDGALYEKGTYKWARCGQPVSSGKCF